MFTDKLTLAIAEAAKKCMDEDLKGNQHKIDANKNGKIDAQDFKLLRKQKGVSEELKGNQHKIDANKNGKIDAEDFKLLRKEDTVNEDSYDAQNVYDKAHIEHRKNNPKTSESEAHKHALSAMKKQYPNHTASSGEGHVYKLNEEDGHHGYVAFSHDGRKADIHANSSYDAHRKAISHFNAPKSKHHMVHVHLAQKGGKDVTHIATEGAVPSTEKTVKLKHKTSGKEVVVTARSANDYKTRGYQHVNEGALDDLRDRQAAKREAGSYGSTAKKEDPMKRTVQGHQYGGAKQKPEKEVDEAVESTNHHYVMAYNRARGVSSIVKKDGEHHLHPSKEAASEHAGKLNAKSSSPHVYYTYGGNINEDMEQREKMVKGMKKNLQGFKARYGDDAKKVMYATATKQAMKEGAVPSTEKTVKVKHATSGKEIVVTTKSADKYKAQGYHPVKEEVEELDEANINAIKSQYKKNEDSNSHTENAELLAKHFGTKSDRDIIARAKAHRDKNNGYSSGGESQKHYELVRNIHSRLYNNHMKEDFEQLDELSEDTLNNYTQELKKTNHSDYNTFKRAIKLKGSAYKKYAHQQDTDVRDKLLQYGRYRKEEVTSDQFKAELEDNKAKAAGTKKQPDVHKAAVQSVKQESFSDKLSMLREGVRSYLRGRNDD